MKPTNDEPYLGHLSPYEREELERRYGIVQDEKDDTQGEGRDLEALRREYRLEAEDFRLWIIDRGEPDTTFQTVDEFPSEPVIRQRPMGRRRRGAF